MLGHDLDGVSRRRLAPFVAACAIVASGCTKHMTSEQIAKVAQLELMVTLTFVLVGSAIVWRFIELIPYPTAFVVAHAILGAATLVLAIAGLFDAPDHPDGWAVHVRERRPRRAHTWLGQLSVGRGNGGLRPVSVQMRA